MLQALIQSPWVERTGWVLVHSLWQFALLALAAGVLQWALRRRSAAARYAALLAIMSMAVALPAVTWFAIGPIERPVRVGVPASAGPSENSRLKADLQRPDFPPPQFGDRLPASAVPAVEQAATPTTIEHEADPHGFPSWWSNVKTRLEPWLPAIVLVWFVGVALFALRPLASWYTVRRLRSVGVLPVADSIRDVLTRTARRLRLARAVTILQSTLVKTPVVIGYFRPLILLPLCVVTGLPESQLELILAHELAHIRRHDYLVNLLQTLIETLFFYHPAVWWLSRQIRNERENCCDDIALSLSANRADYGRALLAIEELRAASPVLSVAAGGGSLLARIRRIGGKEEKSAQLSRNPSLVLFVAILVFAAIAGRYALLGQAKDAPGQSSSDIKSNSDTAPGDIIEGVVVDEQGKPVGGATVRGFEGSGRPDSTAASKADGTFTLRLPVPGRQLDVALVARDAERARQAYFWQRDPDKPRRLVLKPSHVVDVAVADSAARPVAGATVVALDWNAQLAQGETDAQGKLRLEIPADARNVCVFAYKSRVGLDYSEEDGDPTANLDDPRYAPPSAARLVLDGAAPMEVRTVNSAGKPLANVNVALSDLWKPGKKRLLAWCAKLTAKSDSEGRAAFDCLPANLERIHFNVLDDRYVSPRMIEYRLIEGGNPRVATARLARAATLSGRVVHPDGKPAAGVLLQAEGRPADQPQTNYFRGYARTRDDGTYRIAVTPDQSYIVAVCDDRWAAKSHLGLIVKEGEERDHVDFHLERGTLIRGTVTVGLDHRPGNGEVLSRTNVTLVQLGPAFPDTPTRQDAAKRENRDGLPRWCNLNERGHYEFRVAAGEYELYLPSGSTGSGRVVVRDEGEIVVDGHIAKSPPKSLQGHVVDRSGKPVSNAAVRFPSLELTTGPDGHFSTYPFGPCRVYAQSAEANLAGSQTVAKGDSQVTIELSRAATAAGRVLDAAHRPVAGVRVHFYFFASPRTEHCWFSVDAETDKDGKYVMSGLPVGFQGDDVSVIWYNPAKKIYEVFNGPKFTVQAGENRLPDAVLSPATLKSNGPSAGTSNAKYAGAEKPAGATVKELEVKLKPTAKANDSSATDAMPAARSRTSTPSNDSKVIADRPGDRLDFRGTVVDPDGKPVKDAKIYLLYYTAAEFPPPPVRAVSGPDGTFKFTMAKSEFVALGEAHDPWLLTSVAAIADGLGFGWQAGKYLEVNSQNRGGANAAPVAPVSPADQKQTDNLTKPVIRLVRDDVPIVGRIVDANKRPVAGATVRILEIIGNRQNSLTDWLDAVEKRKEGYYAASKYLNTSITGWLRNQLQYLLPTATTDQDGQFRLIGVGRERIARLLLEGPGIATEQLYARTRPGPMLQVKNYADEAAPPAWTYYGAEFEYTAVPSVPIAGAVSDKDTHLPLSGVTILNGRFNEVYGPSGGDFIRAKTDAQGRYRLLGLPSGKGNELLAVPPLEGPYLLSLKKVNTQTGQNAKDVNFELKHGILIRGRVTDAGTGKPVSAQIDYYVFSDNPHARSAPGFQGFDYGHFGNFYQTDAQGNYSIPGLPGRGIVAASPHDWQPYLRGVGAEKIKGGDSRFGLLMFNTEPTDCCPTNFAALSEVDLKENAKEDVVNFAMKRQGDLSVTLLDPENKPLHGAIFNDGQEFGGWWPRYSEIFRITDYHPDRAQTLLFVHIERKLAGSLLLRGPQQGPLTLRLQPWGVLTGCVVDAQGKPQANVFVMGEPFPWAKINKFPPQKPIEKASEGFYVKTDQKGRFAVNGLAPGVAYDIDAANAPMDGEEVPGYETTKPWIGRIATGVVVQSGETKDIGNVTPKLKDLSAFLDPEKKAPAKGSDAKPANEKQPAKPADKALPDKEKPSETEPNGKLDTPPGFLLLPAYGVLTTPEGRRRYGIDAVQENELRKIAEAFKAAHPKSPEAFKGSRLLPPQSQTEYFRAQNEARKQIEDVLTVRQRAGYKHDVACDIVLALCSDPEQGAKTLGLELSQPQKQQLKRMGEANDLADDNRVQQTYERLLAVLTPAQREKLMARFANMDIAGKEIYFPVAASGVNAVSVNSVDTAGEPAPMPFAFTFCSRGGVSLSVFWQLASPEIRKKLQLSAAQQASLQSILAKSRTAAQEVFNHYEPMEAPKRLSTDAEKAKQAEYRQKLESLGTDIVRQIEAALTPQQLVTLRKIVQKQQAISELMQPDRGILKSLAATREQEARIRQFDKEITEPSRDLLRPAAEKALDILTPQQRKSLEEDVGP